MQEKIACRSKSNKTKLLSHWLAEIADLMMGETTTTMTLLRMSGPHESFVWSQFQKEKEGKAKCSVCGKILSGRGSSTPGLLRHLTAKHKIIPKRKGSSSPSTVQSGRTKMPPPSQMNITESFHCKEPLWMVSPSMTSPPVASLGKASEAGTWLYPGIPQWL